MESLLKSLCTKECDAGVGNHREEGVIWASLQALKPRVLCLDQSHFYTLFQVDAVEDGKATLVITDHKLGLAHICETCLVRIEGHGVDWLILVNVVNLQDSVEEHGILLALCWLPHDANSLRPQKVELLQNSSRLLG